MFPQLLYVYIKDLRKCFTQQEFHFTNDFIVNFNGSKLIISKKYNPFDDLWGEKISNINLIVGKNGSGKTTLLDLLGSTKGRRSNLITKPPQSERNGRHFEEWFALYHIVDDVFVIEGNNSNLIQNLGNVPAGTSDEYSICIKYNFFEQAATYFDYIQGKEYSRENNTYTLDSSMISLYMSNNRERDWFLGDQIIEEQDYYVGFKRLYLNRPQYSNIYSFMSEEHKALEENFSAKNALCEIEREEVFKEELNSESLGLFLYQGNGDILLFNNDFDLGFLRDEEEKTDQWTVKEKFIIKFLEHMVIGYWDKRGEKELSDDEKEDCINAINNINFKKDNFINRVKYLLQVLHEVFLALNKKTLLYFNFEIIEKFIRGLIGVQDIYFISDRVLRVRLSEEFNDSIYHLLSLCDELNVNQIYYPFEVKFKNMSSGELEFINVFSNMYTAVQAAISNKNIGSILLLLDEPDASFHPEWSRRFINNLFIFLNNVNYRKEIKFQVLITTHSPFIVSDVPKEHITCIDIIEDRGEGTKRVAKQANFGLMSNFYDIIQNDFFITSPMGEHAMSIFKDVVERINSLEMNEVEEIKKVKAIISSIGDEVIRMKLEELFNDKKIDFLPEKEKLKRINEIEKELRELKETLGEEQND